MSARLLTPAGRGGVSVLELRGAATLRALEELCKDPITGRGPTLTGAAGGDGGPRLVRLRAAGELVDEAVVLVRTDDRVELGLHGSPAVVRRVLQELARAESSAGERSAFDPGGARVGASEPASIEWRAWRFAAEAATEAGARIALAQAGGSLRRELERLALAPPAVWREAIEAMRRRGRSLRGIVTPLRVVLAGPTNAGKSTLFNVLVGRERVVVSPEEGTTRDAIDEPVLAGPYAVRLVDTAGDRTAAAGPERAGQEIGRRRRDSADLVLWLHPSHGAGSAPRPEDREGPPALRVLDSRADEAREGCALARPIAARDDPGGARARVEALVAEHVEALGGAETSRGLPVGAEAFLPELFTAPYGSLDGAGVDAALRELAEVVACDLRQRALVEFLGARSPGPP